MACRMVAGDQGLNPTSSAAERRKSDGQPDLSDARHLGRLNRTEDVRGRYTRRRLDISYENEWYNKEHLPASVRCPAPRALTATAAPAPPSVMWRSTILRRPKFRTRPNGARRRTLPGPCDCGRISATWCASTAAVTGAPHRRASAPESSSKANASLPLSLCVSGWRNRW